jgi:hypothetical protein
MKRIVSLVVVALVMLAIIAVAAVSALADPVKLQPSTEKNCHGAVVAGFASRDPEGIGNIENVQSVKETQQSFREQCEQFPE